MADKVELEIVPFFSKSTVDKIKSVFSDAMSAAQGLRSGTFGGLAGAASGVGGMAAGAVGLSSVGATLGPVVSSIGQILDSITGFVAKANPVVIQMLMMAFDDMQAVIGRTLVPVIKMGTEWVRLFGDVLATILPDASEIHNLMESFRPALDDIRYSMERLAPLINKALVIGVRAAADALTLLVRALLGATEGMLKAVDLLTFGMLNLNKQLNIPTGLSSSFGAAARTSSFVQAEDLSRMAIQGALSRGQTNYAERTAAATEKSATLLERLGQFLLNSSPFPAIGFMAGVGRSE